MIWKIDFTTSSEKEFSKLPKDIQQNIYHYLVKNISPNPRSYGTGLKGSGAVKLWRYRIRDYRLICQIKDEEVTILVIRIGKRDSVYKNLD